MNRDKILYIIIIILVGIFGFYCAIRSQASFYPNRIQQIQINDIYKQQKDIENIINKEINNEIKLNNRILKSHKFNYPEFIETKDCYKVIINLKNLNNDEENVKYNIKDKILTIKGNYNNNSKQKENVFSFASSYYLDREIDANKITKTKDKKKLIITIPFKK